VLSEDEQKPIAKKRRAELPLAVVEMDTAQQRLYCKTLQWTPPVKRAGRADALPVGRARMPLLPHAGASHKGG